MQNQPYARWPGHNDTPVLDAMLDKNHPLYLHHWSECQIYVKGLVLKWASNFSAEEKEDIIQNTTLWIIRYLPDFKRDCRFTTWIIKIVRTRIADAGREKQAYSRQVALPPDDPDNDERREDYISRISSPKTLEEECAIREDLRDAYEKLLDRLAANTNRDRILKILRMHLSGMSQKEIARELNMPEANVGYTIRSTQAYLRQLND